MPRSEPHPDLRKAVQDAAVAAATADRPKLSKDNRPEPTECTLTDVAMGDPDGDHDEIYVAHWGTYSSLPVPMTIFWRPYESLKNPTKKPFRRGLLIGIVLVSDAFYENNRWMVEPDTQYPRHVVIDDEGLVRVLYYPSRVIVESEQWTNA